MSIKESYEKVWVLDWKLKRSEIDFLRNNNTESFVNNENYDQAFWITALIQSLEWLNTINEIWHKLKRNTENVALIQAYFFEDINEIDWILWPKTVAMILSKKSIINLNSTLQSSKTPQINEKLENNTQYTLSKEDFDQYFSWEGFKQWMWSCRLVWAINWMMNLDSYESIIRSSVKLSNDGIWSFLKIKIPLWEPWATEYTISFDEIHQVQSFIKSEYSIVAQDGTTSIDFTATQWINALTIAYWKHVTWRESFDFNRLTWLKFTDFWNQISTLLWNENISVTSKDRSIDKNFFNEFDNALKNFNQSNQILLLWVHLLDQPWINYSKIDHTTPWNHLVSVEAIDISADTVLLSDPNNPSVKRQMKLSELAQYTKSFSLWTILTNY